MDIVRCFGHKNARGIELPSGENEENGAAYLNGCAYILENISFHAGDTELFSALLDISLWQEFMTTATAERIKAALRLPVYSQKEVMKIFKDYRVDFPKEDWWWWPEKIK